jgi:hypothetical protein
VLQTRQEILDQLAGLESVVGPAKKRWADFVHELQPDARDSAERLLGETRKLLEQIMNSDRKDALALEQRKLNLGRQIRLAGNARQINRNYAASAYGRAPSRMDISQ